MVVDKYIVVGGCFGSDNDAGAVFDTVDGWVGRFGPPTRIGYVGGEGEAVLLHPAVDVFLDFELWLGHLGEMDGENRVTVMNGTKGIGEIVVGSSTWVHFTYGEASPSAGSTKTAGVVVIIYTDGIMDGEVERDNRVTVGNSSNGVGRTVDIGKIPMTVNPKHGVAGLLLVNGVVGIVDSKVEMNDRVASGLVSHCDNGCLCTGSIGNTVLPYEIVAGMVVFGGRRGVNSGYTHHHQRVDTVETTQVYAIGEGLCVAESAALSFAETDAVPDERQAVLAKDTVVISAAIALQMECAERVTAEKSL